MERERNGGGAGGGIGSGLVFFDGESLATLVLVRLPFNVIKKTKIPRLRAPFPAHYARGRSHSARDDSF